MIPKNEVAHTSLRIQKNTRREFLKWTSIGATGMILGVQLGCGNTEEFLTGSPEANFQPNIWVNINGSGEVSIVSHRSEMGTGIRTSLPLVIADEMEADWNQVKLVQAVGDAKYGDQNTDGSYSIRMFFIPLRQIGATVRHMMKMAAAREWNVDVSECTAENHKVIHTSGKTLGYGYLAERAADLEVPDVNTIPLKDPSEFRYITKKTSIYDLKDIVTGKAKFGLDAAPEGAKIAVVSRNPEAGAGITSFDDSEASQIAGVHKIFQLESPGFPTNYDQALGGVVIVADNTWSALKAKDALKVNWTSGRNADYDSARFDADMLNRVSKSGKVRREQGNINQALRGASKVISSSYKVPLLSHAPMEPPCAVANVTSEQAEVWAPVQDPQWTRRAVAAALGYDESQVTVNVTLLGGAFGRKSKPDFAVEAALVSREMNMPIKLMWTREDDIRHDFYHFPCAQHIEVGIDDDNKVTGWLHRSVFPPIGGTVSLDAREPASFEISMGLVDLPYDIENVCCETQEAPAKVRIGWLRSVANIHHAFAVGCTLDEVAEARGVDPPQNLLDLLGPDRIIDFPSLSEEFWNYNEKVEDFPWDTSRFRNVIETVRDQSGWGKTLPEGRGMGIAAHRSFLTYVACVVEVEVADDGSISIPNVHYAVDCGIPVNPERIRSQFEGGAAFASSIALKSEISVHSGAVEQSNFHDYQVARMTDSPQTTEVHIIDSQEKPTGVGEPPVPPYIPALCNAIYAATGQRIHELPVKLV